MSCCLFFNDTAATKIYTRALHDALPISTEEGFDATTGSIHPEAIELRRDLLEHHFCLQPRKRRRHATVWTESEGQDRKSTRLNSSHANISYAVFCLKNKREHVGTTDTPI